MTCTLALFLASTLLLPLGDDTVEADTVLLTTGKAREGRVVYEDDEVVILRKGSKDKEYDRADVEEVDSRVRHLAELLKRLDAKGPDIMRDGVALVELAQYAGASRLAGEAEALFLAALLADSKQPVALEALGCRERKGHWSYKKGSKWYRTSELAIVIEKWKDRWALHSVHYTMQSNLPLGQAIRALLDLERFYAAFYAANQTDLRLLEPDESMDIQAHADGESYPNPSDGRGAHFDSSDRLTHVNGQQKPWLGNLIHEAVHHVFYMTTVRSRGGKGKIPSWLNEGMAEIFATGMGGELGFSSFDRTSVESSYVRAQVNTDDPYDLSRVLAFQSDDYESTVNRQLKYAQSYNLVYFLMHGNGGSRADQFVDFLRSAYEGKSSMTDFQKVFKTESKDKFEAKWFAGMEALAETL